jgi:glycosyltransferase involved in cell wall biosynthesis
MFCLVGKYKNLKRNNSASETAMARDIAIGKSVIIYFGDQWDEFWRRRQQIAFRLAQYDDVEKVIYIELPITLATFLRYALGRVSALVGCQCRRVLQHGTLLHLNNKLAIFTPILPFAGVLYGAVFQRFNALICRTQVKLLLKRFFRSAKIEDAITWVSLSYLDLFYGQSPFGLFRTGLNCYDSSEDIWTRPLFASERTEKELQQIRDWDQNLIRQADIVFVNSPIQFKAKETLKPSIFLISNGVGLDVFHSRAKEGIPEDLRGIDHPILGFVGGIFDSQVDFDLLRYIATQQPGWHIILIGMTNALSSARLQDLKNVHILGPKRYLDLARYLACCDICLGLYKANNSNRTGLSLKLPIYLAMGKPVVSTDAAGADLFGDVVSIAHDYKEFVSLVEQSLTHHHPALVERRVAVARKYSWGSQVQQIHDILLAQRVEIANQAG